ncbi:MAG: enoyl-CoA hydratase [Gammaproteobacteria bacterium]|nr:enoyl-CoA hydratase [Gammaproteobacteria bacterium]|tara:strand:- start:5464 stop:6240 length:777 start_codon:yes stop_codon:yes gene_type:complete
MTDYQTLTFDARDGIGWLTLNRPERLNAMTNRMVVETHDCLAQVADRTDVRVLVLTGAGRGFCPGADLKHFSAGEDDIATEPRHFHVPVLLHEMPQVTIAAVNGACAGAGFGWACACDLRVAARGASFNSAFLNVASAGDMAGPWTLPRLVGAARARDLYLLPDKFDADQALAWGLVTRVFEPDAFQAEVAAIAARLAAASPHALRTMKQNFLDAERLPLDRYVDLETERHMEVMAHDDAKEAFRAFVEKRPPRFGRS